MMNFTCYYDRIKIYAPFLPMGHALTNMKIRKRTDAEMSYIKNKRYSKVVYRYVAKGEMGTLMYEPCFKEGYIKQAPVSVLSIKADGKTPTEIADIAFGVFGTLDKLTIGYIESRVDLFDIDFDAVIKNLLVQGKKRINDTYRGQTVYFGSVRSGHQVVLYDKGLQLEGIPGSRIRIEARNRYKIGKQPLLIDFLRGNWRQATPFRKTFLINSDNLPLTKGERISLSKRGLTKFMKTLKGQHKSTILKHAHNNIVLDLNLGFRQWEGKWLGSIVEFEDILGKLTIPIIESDDGSIILIKSPINQRFAPWEDDE